MPLFPVIDIESLVQEEDKTRIDVAKSYASGSAAITAMAVSPSVGVMPVDVFENGYLDWQYPFEVSVLAASTSNNKLDFAEDGVPFVATLDDGEYTLADLAQEIATQMSAVGTLVYETSVSAANAITITANGAFQLLGATGDNVDGASVLAAIGVTTDTVAKVTVTGEDIERITKKITLTVGNDEVVTPGDPNALPNPIPDVLLTKTIIREIEVVSELADKLFSADDRLRKHESDIMKYLSEGRATFKDVHRRVQTLILAWLDTQGFIDNLGRKLTLKRITDIEEAAEWATMMALRLIFESVRTAADDIFALKAKKYEGLEDFYRNRATLKIDLNQDGVADAITERLDIRSCVVVRR